MCSPDRQDPNIAVATSGGTRELAVTAVKVELKGGTYRADANNRARSRSTTCASPGSGRHARRSPGAVNDGEMGQMQHLSPSSTCLPVVRGYAGFPSALRRLRVVTHAIPRPPTISDRIQYTGPSFGWWSASQTGCPASGRRRLCRSGKRRIAESSARGQGRYCVTRTTSSSVVTPSRTCARHWSRSVLSPCSRAHVSSACSDARARICSRIAGVMRTIS